MEFPPIPLESWIDAAIAWLVVRGGPIFDVIGKTLSTLELLLRDALRGLPPYVMIPLLVAFPLFKRRFRTAALLLAALLLIWNLELWREAMQTVSLVLIAAGLSLGIAVPLGILAAESRLARSIIEPVLDYMQTTPAFVYLIPAVLFFGVGTVPGILATMAFALPPPIRATSLGIAEVDPQIVEAAVAFGSSRRQLLLKIKLPLALPYIWVGVNQCIMMSLSMVVIASLIGATGLGTRVVEGLSQFDIGKGVEAGVAVVAVAIALDRLFAAGGGKDGSKPAM
ncbi:MAG: ABC transporter permease subunit [Rhodospirillales bacterium]|nr:ABC transporter permease subunit [Rhodospirillales bacterium]